MLAADEVHEYHPLTLIDEHPAFQFCGLSDLTVRDVLALASVDGLQPVQVHLRLQLGSAVTISPADPRTVVVEAGDDGQERREQKADRVFSAAMTQAEVFEAAVAPLVRSVLRGCNATCILDGQAGAGPSYTMVGPSRSEDPVVQREERGMLLRAAELLFDRSASCADHGFCVAVSCMCSYDRRLLDLLREDANRPSPPERLRTRTQPPTTTQRRHSRLPRVRVDGLSWRRVESAEEAKEAWLAGRARAGLVTGHGSALSSLVFAARVQSCARPGGVRLEATLSLVELCSSERPPAVVGATLQQARRCVSRERVALSSCVGALARGARVIPFRDSQLTHLLQNSLAGDSRTCFIFHLPPSASARDEALKTLALAARAGCLRTRPAVNVWRAEQKGLWSLPLELQARILACVGAPAAGEHLRAVCQAWASPEVFNFGTT